MWRRDRHTEQVIDLVRVLDVTLGCLQGTFSPAASPFSLHQGTAGCAGGPLRRSQVSGCKRKIDSSRLRFLIKAGESTPSLLLTRLQELGVPKKDIRSAQLAMDSIYLRARTKKGGLSKLSCVLSCT
eukprot:746270-Hanusia_phi.AAC.3